VRTRRACSQRGGCDKDGATTGIRLFAECSALCRVLFVGHSTNKSLSSAALGKVLLSVTTTFTESRALGTEIHSAKKHVLSAKHLAKNGPRQRGVSNRLKLTVVIFAERRALALGKEAALLSVRHLTFSRACYAECQKWQSLLYRDLFAECHIRQRLCRVFFRALDSGSGWATHDV
jgi:hypothetical protein